MSVVQETVREIQLGQIPSRIALYEQLIAAAEPIFELKGKGLEQACKEHAQNHMYYNMMLQECKTISASVRTRVDAVESSLFKKYNENNQRALSRLDIGQYIKSEPQYVAAYEILQEVLHVQGQLDAIVEAIKDMGWMLSHITKLRIAQLEDATL